MISERTVDSVFALARIEEVVEDFVQLRRAGSNFTGLCPFHDEKTPSFMVSPSKNIYKCFGCGQGGNPVNFIMEHEKLSFPEAIKILAGKYNITVEETEVSDEYKQEKQLVESYYIINEFAQDYFVKNLFETQEGQTIGLSYFKERGFIEKTMKTFGLGYAPDERKEFLTKALRAQYKEEYLIGVGLVSERKFDFFNQRVIFPIHNLTGKVIGFAGRILTSNNKKAPKYINSKESEIYNKRSILYGMYQAKGAIRKNDTCFLVEGYTDVISMHQAGVEHVVASSGTSLTIGQIKLIKRFTENIIMLFDGDKAGIKAALRGVDLVLEQDMNVKVVILPDGEDPDSFVKAQGLSGFNDFIENNSSDLIRFKTNLFLEEAGNDPIKRSEFIGDIVDSLAKIPNTIKRSLYVQECAESLNIEEKLLISEINKRIKKEVSQRAKIRIRNESKTDSSNGSKQSDDKQAPSLNKFIASGSDVYQENDIMRVFISFGGEYHKEKQTSMAEYIYSNIEKELPLFENKSYVDIINTAMEHISKNNKNKGKTNKDDDPLFGDIETDSTDSYVPVINTNFYTQHPDPKIRSVAIDLLTEQFSYADWEKRGVELQTQKKPKDNFINDSYRSIIQFKLRKIRIKLKEINKRIDSAKADGKNDQISTLLQAYKMTLEYRNNLAKELQQIVL